MEKPPPRVTPALVVANVAAAAAELWFIAELQTWWFYRQEAILLMVALVAALVAPALLLLARTVARARLRTTGVDSFAKLRRWASSRPRALSALLAAPSALAFVASIPWPSDEWFWQRLRSWPLSEIVGFVTGLWVLPAVGLALVAHASLRALIALLADDAKGSERNADGFFFSAVAVTPETRATVGAVSLVSIAAAILFATSSLSALASPVVLAALIAYIAAAVGTTAAFHRASRIALGFDGVLITGTSRKRFFPYRDIDEAETTRGGDLVLRRHGKVTLRLQLHGEDAARSRAILDRLRAGIERARNPGGGGAHALAEAASEALLARAARGDADYRTAGATREEVWELVEAPATAGATRAAAAAALAPGLDGAGRERLRVAAETCAEPAVRETLQRLAEEEAEIEASSAVPPNHRALRMNPAR